MPTYGMVEYENAGPEVKAVYDEIRAARKTDYINNYWKSLAHDPKQLRAAWDNVRQVMAAGALDPLVKELIYVAVSATNGCAYCIASHTAQAKNKGMTPEMFVELMAVVGLANSNNKVVQGYQIEVDEAFKTK